MIRALLQALQKKNTSSDDIADVSTLRPFNFEPVMSKEEQEKLIISSSSSSDESENDDSRIGNNEWCLCGGHCRPMQSYTESLCCRDTNEIPDEMFEGIVLTCFLQDKLKKNAFLVFHVN